MSYEKFNKLHIVSVVAVIRRDDGKYLLLKRSEREIAYPGMYTFPGGKMEDNETVEEALKKEIFEEAGLEMKPGKILLKDKSFIRPDGQTVKVLSFLCGVVSTDNVIISGDFTDYKWVSIEDLKHIPHVGLEEELRKAEEIYRSGFNVNMFSTKSEKDVLI